MKGDVPSCRYCHHGWIFYAIDSEGAVFPLRRPIACDCAGGRTRQGNGAASWRQLFYRKHWHRVDNHEANRIDNERRQAALTEELGVKPLPISTEYPIAGQKTEETQDTIPF